MEGLKTKLTLVPENRLYKRKIHELRRARDAKKASLEGIKRKKIAASSNKLKFIRAEEFVRKYREVEKDQKRVVLQSKLLHKKHFQIPKKSKLAFVVRVKRIDMACEKVKRLIVLMRLNKVNSGVFLELDDFTRQVLNIIEPYVVWGFPNLKTIRELIYKRAFGRIKKRRVAITDNNIIEQNLGEHDMICIEDLVHQIFTVGPQFKEATNFLWPFQFKPSRQAFNKAAMWTIGDGKFGFRGENINDFIKNWN